MDVSDRLLEHIKARSFTDKFEWIKTLNAFDKDVVEAAHRSPKRDINRSAIQAGEDLEQLLGWLVYGNMIVEDNFVIEVAVAHIRASVAAVMPKNPDG